MGFLFKSKAERQRERHLKFMQNRKMIQRHITENEKQFDKYRALAVRAKQTHSPQLPKIMGIMLRTQQSISKLNELLLSLELIYQNKKQAESMGAFAVAMQAATKSMADVLDGFDPNQLSADYDKAMQQAEELDEQMDMVFDEIDSSTTSLPAKDMADIEALIHDDVKRVENALLNSKGSSKQGEWS